VLEPGAVQNYFYIVFLSIKVLLASTMSLCNV
jgi:hypothetical protein